MLSLALFLASPQDIRHDVSQKSIFVLEVFMGMGIPVRMEVSLGILARMGMEIMTWEWE